MVPPSGREGEVGAGQTLLPSEIFSGFYSGTGILRTLSAGVVEDLMARVLTSSQNNVPTRQDEEERVWVFSLEARRSFSFNKYGASRLTTASQNPLKKKRKKKPVLDSATLLVISSS